MWACPCPPWALLALSRGHQPHVNVTQPSVSVPFGAFWFSCVSDTYSLFSGVCLSFYFSSKEQKEWKGYVRAHQSSAFPALYFVPRSLTRVQRTRLAQRLLEWYHCQRKTTMMWYTYMWLIWSECHGDLVSVSVLVFSWNCMASEENWRLNSTQTGHLREKTLGVKAGASQGDQVVCLLAPSDVAQMVLEALLAWCGSTVFGALPGCSL